MEPGRTLSHFRLIEKIGEGGMGVVWRAVDTTLDREVAIKILPESFAADPGRLARFQREAKMLASLNHENIAAVFSVHREGDLPFLAMELVPGEDLRSRLARGPLAVEEVFPIASQIIQALAAAHARGIIHRDLKPANIRLRPDGRVKVLDFGLAKALGIGPSPGDVSHAPTRTRDLTGRGEVLGTLPYMAPETLRGLPAESASDVWALGVLLYEMAAGQRPFQGKTSFELSASILNDSPPPLPPRVPERLRAIIERCLAKEPTNRVPTALDLRDEWNRFQEGGSPEVRTPRPALTAGWRTSRRLLLGAAAVMATAVLVFGYLGFRRLTTGARFSAPIRVRVSRITSQPGTEAYPSLSMDGRTVAYSSEAGGNSDIYLQRIGGEKPINLTEDCEGEDYQPAFAPDAESIAFRSERMGGGIFVMGATGESVRRITDFGYNPAWSPDGRQIVFATESIGDPMDRSTKSVLWTVDPATGERRQLTQADSVQPSWSPHGYRIAFWGQVEQSGQRDIWTVSANGGDPVAVTGDAAVDWNPIWSPDGAYLYFASDRDGSMNLWRVAIHERSGATRGDPEPITTGASAVRQHPAMAADGRRIVYVEMIRLAHVQRVAFDPATGTARGEPVSITPMSVQTLDPHPSPDGTTVAFRTVEPQEDILVIDRDGNGQRRLTNDPFKDRRPRWSPDGRRIAFYSDRGGSYEVWAIDPDGSGLEQLTDSGGRGSCCQRWSPDGTRLSYLEYRENDSFVLDLSKPRAERVPLPLPPLNDSGARFGVPAWSPDGRWLAAEGVQVDDANLGLFLYSLNEGTYRKLTDSGHSAEWLPDSRRILFADGGKVHLVDIESGDRHEVLSLEPPAYVGYVFSLALDGREIYFTHVRDESDIWMLSLQ